MKNYRTIIILLLALFACTPIQSQSFEEQLKIAEKAKRQYGETDDRYLDALSSAIQAAFAEEKDEEANKYRLIHSDIVKQKFGQNSLEYAEDIWRLGNVSDFKGEEYVFNCYKKAEEIYNEINGQAEYPYCDIMFRLFSHYADAEDLQKSLYYLDKHLSLSDIWISKEWKGLTIRIEDLPYKYIILGQLHEMAEDLSSAHTAYVTALELSRDVGDNQNIINATKLLIKVYEKQGIEDTDVYFDALGYLIFKYHVLQMNKEAYELYDHYEELADKLIIKDEDYLAYLSLKARTLLLLEKGATPEYQKTLKEIEELSNKFRVSNSNIVFAESFTQIERHIYLNQLDSAQILIDQCYIMAYSNKHIYNDTNDSIEVMAQIHIYEGKINDIAQETDQAINSYLKAIEEIESINHLIHSPYVALGRLYSDYYLDFQNALTNFNKAQQILESKGDNYSLSYIEVLLDIGDCYEELGNSSKGLAIIDLASQILLNNYDNDHTIYGRSEMGKANIYYHLSCYSEAINCVTNALECYKNVYGKNSDSYSRCLATLGDIYTQLGDDQKAEEFYKQSISVWEKQKNPMCVRAYLGLLILYSDNQDVDTLLLYINKTIDMINANNLGNTRIGAAALRIFAYILLLYDGIDISKRYYKGVLDYYESIDMNIAYYYPVLVEYGLVTFYDSSQSEDFIPKLFSAYKNMYFNNAIFYNDDERESLITSSPYNQTKDILFSSRQEGKYDTELFDFLLFYKGLLLGTKIEYAQAIYNCGDQEIIDKYEKTLLLQRYLTNINNITNSGNSIDDAKSIASNLQREITTFLRQNGIIFSELSYTYDDVKNNLGKNQIAIEFVKYEDYSIDSEDGIYYYAALIASPDWPEPKFIKLCKTEQLEKLASLSPDKLYGETKVSEEAYSLIWAPLAPYLANVETVYFSPAGHINKIAIEHLYNGNKHFDAMYDVIRLTSTRQLCIKNPQYKYSKSVLYGGLRYDEDDATMIAESRNIRGDQPVQPNLFRGYDNTLTRKGWEYLPGTLEEVNQISSIISKSKIKCDLYTSVKGNEESFKALSGNNFGILHIATHGFYMTESQAERNDYFASNPFLTQGASNEVSPLQRSGLLLAGANKAWKGEDIPEGVEDGILTAAEIASLDLNSCDIVVLSACETGLGEITDEGVLGLQRAFKNAGVNTIIMSLWEVDDRATTLMMESFYKNLMKGKSKRDSFAEAQNEVKKKFADPRYWAAFIMLD